jgi:hypothetical protein
MKANPVGKLMTELDNAYIAGFIDGDGAIMACIEKNKEKKFGYRVRVTLKISQKKLEHVKWLPELTGFGVASCNKNDCYWVVKDQSAIKHLIEHILPYLKVKKKQAEIVIEILNLKITTQSDLVKAAKLADTVAFFNVRSALRRKNFAESIQLTPVTTDLV